jgi:hypothetical protein
VFLLIYKVELAVNKILIILSLVLLASCGLSQDEKENIAAITCSIMSETRNMDAAVRVEKMNDAREKIGGEPFLSGDDAIKEAFEYGLCHELVLDESYNETLQHLKDAKRERRRAAAEKRAEEQRIVAIKRAEEQRIVAMKRAEEQRIAAEKQRIADSKPTVKEELHSNGNLKSRTTHQSKIDGGEKHGLHEAYYENGQLLIKENYKDGKKDGFHEFYYKNGQLGFKVNYNDGKEDGLYEWYKENGQLQFKDCYKDGKETDMSYCEK